MSEVPGRARAVIIGAGIVGNSLAYHLAKLGWRDLVLIDKGPMPNPGGSTGHASNFIFPIEYNKMMMELTRDSTEQYKQLGVFTESGGIEVARTPERMVELLRRTTAAKAWGIPFELLDPAGVRELVPYLDDSVILGGASFPTVGVVDSLRAGTLMREHAQASGALTVVASTEILGISTVPHGGRTGGRITGVQTTAGDIETELVVICCGVWSPRLAAMAGAHIPLTPIVHQMISVGPIGLFDQTPGEISYPIVRDVDENMYERQHGGDLEVGSYAHRPMIVEPDSIPSIEQAVLSPTELPFTSDDFDPQLEKALELMPDLLGDETAGMRYAINGLISMTPDGHPAIGETPEVAGLWSVAASWIKEGPGIGRAAAEWLTGGTPEIDIHEADIARFYAHQRTNAHVTGRAAEAFNKMYGIIHPAEQWESGRPLRLPPAYERERDLGAVFYETAGWERPFWYESNAPLLERFAGQLGPDAGQSGPDAGQFGPDAGRLGPDAGQLGADAGWLGADAGRLGADAGRLGPDAGRLGPRDGRLMPRSGEWESRWWSPIINAEHLAMRESAALIDLSAFAILDVDGPGALAAVQYLSVAQLDVPVGRVVYTSLLDDAGGFRADLTIMRLATDRFRVVTGGATGMMDLKWILDHLPSEALAAGVSVTDVTSAWTTLGLWGPKAREILGAVASGDISHDGFAFGTCREIEVGSVTVLASRISYVGELGWELHLPFEQGARLWDTLWDAGQGHGLIAAGIGVYGTTGRLEKGYRAFGAELTGDFNLVEAGMTRPKVKAQDFVGKVAYLDQRSTPPVAVLCTLTIDDPVSASSGSARYPLGGEPILGPDGAVLTDARGRTSYVTSAGSGPSLGRHILLSYLPAEHAVAGNQFTVEYLGEQYPVTVAVAGSTPLFDPANERIRC